MTGTRRATRATVRKAVASDVAAIVGLVRRFAEENLMLPRNAGSVYSALRDFAVAVDGGGEVLACCALSIIAEGLA
jgi:N-acetylglutamate synthase-like GNAT family acetyltransferase